MSKQALLWVAASLFAVSANAQDIIEAYNLSGTSVQGTARSIGFGNALGSIGGDFSSLSVNPAGIGVYRTSELSFSPSLKLNYATSTFQGKVVDDNNARINLNQFGVIFTEAPKGRRYDHRNWKAISFGIGMNRISDFNRDYNYTGINTTGSASLLFEADANRNPYDLDNAGTLRNMGIDAGLLTPHLSSYYSTVPFAGGITQANTVSERGGINEYVATLGGNYKERLMLGATIAIPVMDYHRTSDYSETVLPGNAANTYNFNTFVYHNQLNISGTGFNAKLGAILKLTNFLRIGAAFHTPTVYSIQEHTEYGISSIVDNVNHTLSTNYSLPVSSFDYSFITPYKGVLSASLVIKKLGFITADYEIVDYSTMKYIYPDGIDAGTGISFRQEQTDMNNAIKNNYQAASNIRLGAEIKLTKFLMVRGGIGYYGNPYKTGTSAAHTNISAGIGFHTKNFFADLGVVNTSWTFREQAYSDVDYNYVATPNTGAPAPIATIQPTTNNASLTLGLKF